MILNPKRLTWRRYWRMIRSPYTLLRSLQYECLEGLSLSGNVLDVGGGKRTSYSSLLSIEGTLESINADSSIEPTYIADLNKGIPVADERFDHVISFNTLEHIWSDELVLSEMFRVLKPNGTILILVPFLYRVHGFQCDFHRRTAYWWEKKLEEIGFSDESIVVEPLAFDELGTGYALSESWRLPLVPWPSSIRFLRRACALLYGTVYQTLRWRNVDRVPNDYGLYFQDFALGYRITAKK